MWLDNLKNLKKEKGMSTKQIVEKTGLPEKTVSRILSGETDNPRIDTLHRITTALGVYLDDIFAESTVVVAPKTLAEVKENADALKIENTELKEAVALLTKENERLNMELKHKDELLELHNFYNKLIHKKSESTKG